MPRNYPYWQVVRFGIPALLAGYAIVLKHAPNDTGATLALGRLFSDSGVPPGLFTALVVEPQETAEVAVHLIGDDRIVAVTSNATGSWIARTAGAQTKKALIELGGSDPLPRTPTCRPRGQAQRLLTRARPGRPAGVCQPAIRGRLGRVVPCGRSRHNSAFTDQSRKWEPPVRRSVQRSRSRVARAARPRSRYCAPRQARGPGGRTTD